MATLRFVGATKRYRDGTVAVDDLHLDVDDGELVVLVGPSGCGKSTALRMVAGLETPTGGDIEIGDRSVLRTSPGARDVAMVFQNYALYPHMTVRQNMMFGLRSRGIERATAAGKVDEVARFLGLEPLLARKPRELSGGQRQRVAMGRAIVREPKAFLMDEPLSNLDAQLRVQMRTEVVRIQRELSATTLYVTHDQVEAMTMGHRVAVLAGGRLQQFAAPLELYERPASTMVARFIGSPPMNLVPGVLVGAGLRVGDVETPLSPDVQSQLGAGRTGPPDVVVGFRAEECRLGGADEDDDDALALDARIVAVEQLGADALVHVQLAAGVAATAGATADVQDAGTRAVVRAPGGSRPAHGERVRVVVPLRAMRLFDRATGSAMGDLTAVPRPAGRTR